MDSSSIIAQKSERYPYAPELTGISAYVNSEPFMLKDLIGKKVVMIDFWTLGCINCQHTLPYVTAWYSKYRDQGLEIVGVHTPEFDYEKVRANVEEAIREYGIEFSVVQDNEFGTWRAYSNQYWPRVYLIDIDGYVVYDHAGEGAYEVTEAKIQELLRERQERMK
jgi:thiol-disulfide isomerase/thioredoxin